MKKDKINICENEYYIANNGRVFGPTWLDSDSILDGHDGDLVGANDHFFKSNGIHNNYCTNYRKNWFIDPTCDNKHMNLIKKITAKEAQKLIKKQKLEEELKELQEEYIYIQNRQKELKVYKSKLIAKIKKLSM